MSLGKVEATLKLHELVEAACVCARPSERAAVALVVPDQVTRRSRGRDRPRPHPLVRFFQASLEKLAAALGKGALTRAELCKDPAVVGEVLERLAAYGARGKLERFEIPKAVTLVDAPW